VHKRDDTTRQLAEDFVLPISRVQLEQDTAKTTTIQQLFNYNVFEEPLNSEKEMLGRIQEARQVQEKMLLDHNRSSIPLIEIITPPVLTSPHQAATALTKVAEILRATGVATADFHLGAMRCDVNVSLGLNSARTEIKNLFSSSAVRDACTFEIASLVELFHSQQEIVSQTKTWDGSKTVALREKEGEKDYRYCSFPGKEVDLGIYLMRIYLRYCWIRNLFRKLEHRYPLYQITSLPF
jgi:Asp-tRNA(Asn)/Glu-tRNA(Gln) amidotransferase B subunit